MLIEYSVEHPAGRGYFYAELELPATQAQIRDAQQKARLIGRENSAYCEIEITSCPELPELTGIRLDSPTVEELNFFAGRLDQLSQDERLVLNAIVHSRNEAGQYENGLSMKELINLTYGLDGVMIASNVGNVRQLGQFVIENDLLEDVVGVPSDALPLLDAAKIGEMQKEMDSGIFWQGHYIVAGDYTPQEVYDGVKLPEAEEPDFFVFRLKIGEYPTGGTAETEADAEWIELPMDADAAQAVAQRHHEPSISSCICYGFESAIPQITDEMFGSMRDFEKLNRIAAWYQTAPEMEQIKYKAVLEGHEIGTLSKALTAALELDKYELAYYCDDENDYFREFLRRHLDAAVDSRWLDNINMPREANDMVQRIGAVYSDYGVVSARDGHLFAPISYDEPEDEMENEESEQEGDQNEGMEMKL